jgi:hypothetical protein
MVRSILEHSTRDDITADELREVADAFNALDVAHQSMDAAWDGTQDEFLAAIARLKECDRVFWTTVQRLMPMTRDELEKLIEGERTGGPLT